MLRGRSRGLLPWASLYRSADLLRWPAADAVCQTVGSPEIGEDAMTQGAIEWLELHCDEGGSEKLGRFYEEAFGWKVQVDPNMPDYAMFSDPSGNVSGGFTSSLPKGTSPRIYITVDSADAALAAVGKGGGTPKEQRTLITEEIGYWATFLDPAGNEIGLFEKK
jgi:predicted enzyme related to lactoylglutathione lyase